MSEELERIMDDYIKQASEQRAKRLEFLAAAFLSETGLRPSECELVEEHRNNSMVWFYRKRETPKPDVEIGFTGAAGNIPTGYYR